MTDDPTSPTMYLIHSSGFSSKDCLIFDEICRRDETRDVLWFYNEDLYRHHRDFVCNLRENMSAVVEICWGKDVWNIMEKTNPRLARFPLWGSFKDVRLWLELDGQSLKRFIIHVYHPQFFCRIGQEKLRKSTSEFREKYGKPQDLALLMAAQFVGLQDRINSQFFSTDLKLGRYPRLKGDQNHRRENHLQSARGSFRVAFPEKYREFELKEAQKAMEQRVFQALETERHVSATSFESMTPMVTLPPLEVSVEEQVSNPLTTPGLMSNSLSKTSCFAYEPEMRNCVVLSHLSTRCLKTYLQFALPRRVLTRVLSIWSPSFQSLRTFPVSSLTGLYLKTVSKLMTNHCQIVIC